MADVAAALRRTVRGGVKVGEPLSKHTSVRIGGPAAYFVECALETDVLGARRVAEEAGLPFRVIGNGSNLLVGDTGFPGIVLCLGRKFNQVRFEGHRLIAQAGASLPRLAKVAVDQGLSGLEYAGGIPGSLGGAVVMNAGAHGSETAAVIDTVSVVDPNGTMQRWSRGEMQFSYRRSRLSGDRDHTVVGAELTLLPDNPELIRGRMREYAARRRTTQPLGVPSSGSVFKNPQGDFAGRLIEAAGLKGTRIGGAMVSLVHGNFIVNCGDATAHDVMRVIEFVRQRVLDEFAIELQLEVELMAM